MKRANGKARDQVGLDADNSNCGAKRGCGTQVGMTDSILSDGRKGGIAENKRCRRREIQNLREEARIASGE